MLKRAIPGKDGNKYVPYDERHGEKSVVFLPATCPKKDSKRFTTKSARCLKAA